MSHRKNREKFLNALFEKVESEKDKTFIFQNRDILFNVLEWYYDEIVKNNYIIPNEKLTNIVVKNYQEEAVTMVLTIEEIIGLLEKYRLDD